MALLRKCDGKLRLKVNEAKSAVASVKGRKFLGYSFWLAKEGVKRRVADKPMATFKQRIRQLTRRSGGRGMGEVIERLKPYLMGWKAYVQIKTKGRNLVGRQKGRIDIQPGMTAMVEIKTGSNTVLRYLTKPITKTLSESLGER